MKKFIIIILLINVFSSGVLSAKEKNTKAKSVKVYSKEANTFYFRVKADLIGGVVEVYDANRQLLGYEELSEREMLIDFTELPSGKYFIKIVKSNYANEFSLLR